MDANRYDFKALQEKWKPRWQAEGLYKTGSDPKRAKFYCLDFFPYPSGSGLSVGHLRNYVPTDVISRMKRMQGLNVLHPMGWDAFGLPAENYALKMGVHPSLTTAQNVANYKRQLALAETSYDWDKEINSSSPDYYRWTQWLFLLLHERGLAYQAEGYQWFCDECGTVLANEQVENGLCWRHEKPVSKRKLKQWFFKITEYAERLLDGLDTVDWPEHIKLMQRNWIGKSIGSEVHFKAELASGETVDFPIFTTRIDTIFGVTYMVIAPEHPLLEKLVTSDRRADVTAYVEATKAKSEIERTSTEKEKSGVFTGAHAINPLTGERIPIWTADYVLAHYGTGIVMAVPHGDSRDYAFARKFGLPIKPIVEPPAGATWPENDTYTGYGTMINSGKYSGLSSEDGIARLNEDIEAAGIGRKTINYKFRDWLISRQRYWGVPIPIVHCHGCGAQAVPKDQLPVMLPDIKEFKPSGTGKGPLATVPEFVKATCPACGGAAERETDTMDGFACSSWYFLRFPDNKNDRAAFSKESARYWLPVDLYVGGAEHAVMHLLYARFWTKVMFDAGLIEFQEPFAKLRNQGMVLGADGQKMSKSKGNVVTPDEVVERFGCDTLRGYLLQLGTFELEVAWSDEAITGINRYLYRVWDLVTGRRKAEEAAGADAGDALKTLERKRHQTIKKVTQDIDTFSFNTAVAALMEYANTMSEAAAVPGVRAAPAWETAVDTLLILLAPIAPFITEELWEATGRREKRGSVHVQTWPSWDEASLVADQITYPVQINGKVRDRVEVPATIAEEALKEAVLGREAVRKYTDGKQIAKFIVVPGRLVSIAVK